MNEWVLIAVLIGGMFLLMGGGGLLLSVLRGARKNKTS